MQLDWRSLLSRVMPYVWRICLLLAVGLLAFTVYLDIQIVKKFEGQKWALPAHVYTRPLELYVGQSLSKRELLDEFEELGYLLRPSADRIGTFDVTSNRIAVYQREFRFWDGLRAAQRVELSYRELGSSVIEITHMAVVSDAGPSISPSIVRLEPRLFGSVSPMSH